LATKYLTYEEAVTLHILLMRRAAEERFGVFSRPLVESALARPRQAAAYENADLIRQAATLFRAYQKPSMGRRQQKNRYRFD
jgi:prophage maintenance system killer protein